MTKKIEKARVVVVTGGTRGIGAAISKTLHGFGYKVAATYMGNDAAAKEFKAKTGIDAVYKFDVSDYDACAENIAKIEKDLGPVDILVNNAGITRDSFLHKMTPKQWNEVIRTNLDSVFNMTRLVIEGMRDRGFGRVISISSINGLAGAMGQTNYSAAKAGIIGFSKSLALEVASKGVTVNVIAPGYIDTDMVRAIAPEVLEKIVAKIPVKKLGNAEGIARLVAFLANDDNGFTTGATFNVNGGQYLA
ncbi:MAG: acetoacetyl-CoA reductase [Proteobacteria bacterium]|jgi:acetoacetyl-CoA reductase|nr:acetoacetyl-CoA reductase [Alphaproteobacteria bacterium]NCC03731.1 acetoacetyl-CoA reductase [Pseudomonadota bacterium]